MTKNIKAITDKHKELSVRALETSEKQALIPDVNELINTVRLAGETTPPGDNRETLRSLVTYWASFSYENSEDQVFPNVELAPYLGHDPRKKRLIFAIVIAVIVSVFAIALGIWNAQRYRGDDWLKIIDIDGSVQYQNDEISPPVRIQQDEIVKINNNQIIITTGVSGNTFLRLYDSTTIRLQENSIIKIELIKNSGDEFYQPLIIMLNGTSIIESDYVKVREFHTNEDVLVENEAIQISNSPESVDFLIVKGIDEGQGWGLILTPVTYPDTNSAED